MHCPSITIFGTFFPSWMLSAVIGLCGLIVVHALAVKLHFVDRLNPRPLVYPSIAFAITCFTWLSWYGH